MDTNIISIAAESEAIAAATRSFMTSESLWLGLSGMNLIELQGARRKHAAISRFLASVKVALLDLPLTIVSREIAAYPELLSTSEIITHFVGQTGDHHVFEKYLSSQAAGAARAEVLNNAKFMMPTLDQRKNNFPPGSDGVYTADQAGLYEFCVIVQKLQSIDPKFLHQFRDRVEELHIDRFRSMRLAPLTSFYKYYLGRRTPKKSSDLADLGHLGYVALCDWAVLEKDNVNVLFQISRNSDATEHVKLRDIDFLRTLAN